MRLLTVFLFSFFISITAQASKILIPMDSVGQANHLKAYGVAYVALQEGIKVDWLLNYKSGSFGMNYDEDIAFKCKMRGLSYIKMTEKQYAGIVKQISDPNYNGAVVKLGKPPKIGVYTPTSKEPWDDAVTLALTYAEIPFDKIYVDEVLAGGLNNYDWLHLHHEDFTGQYGKFWVQFHNAEWYKQDKAAAERLAVKHGYKKVSQMQLAVAKKIKDFVGNGGNMFAMCSATETIDIALAAEGTDICDTQFDNDPVDPYAQSKLDFRKCFAFKDFRISTNAYDYGHSNIDNTITRGVPQEIDYFELQSFPAKLDPVPAMLCQNHTMNVKGFMGQTTAFRDEVLKPGVLVMGENKSVHEARYIHGEYEQGMWTFYGGHDPEAYRHLVNDPATDLSHHPNSPGYRLILNNVLCRAAKRKVVQTVVCCDSIAKAEKKTSATDNVVSTANPVKIYPDPSSNELIISSSNKIENITIFNTNGVEVFKKSYSSQKVSIDMDELGVGMYLIKVNGEYAGKVVKN